MTTKVVYLKPKSIICGLNEVKVMRHTDIGKTVENTDFHLQIKSCNLPLVLGVKCFKSISSFFLNVTCIGFFTF
jgi:hypothetical protein